MGNVIYILVGNQGWKHKDKLSGLREERRRAPTAVKVIAGLRGHHRALEMPSSAASIKFGKQFEQQNSYEPGKTQSREKILEGVTRK